MTHKYFLRHAGADFGQFQSDVPVAAGDVLSIGDAGLDSLYTVKTVIHRTKVIQTGKKTGTEDTYTFYATDVTTLVLV